MTNADYDSNTQYSGTKTTTSDEFTGPNWQGRDAVTTMDDYRGFPVVHFNRYLEAEPHD